MQRRVCELEVRVRTGSHEQEENGGHLIAWCICLLKLLVAVHTSIYQCCQQSLTQYLHYDAVAKNCSSAAGYVPSTCSGSSVSVCRHVKLVTSQLWRIGSVFFAPTCMDVRKQQSKAHITTNNRLEWFKNINTRLILSVSQLFDRRMEAPLCPHALAVVFVRVCVCVWTFSQNSTMLVCWRQNPAGHYFASKSSVQQKLRRLCCSSSVTRTARACVCARARPLKTFCYHCFFPFVDKLWDSDSLMKLTKVVVYPSLI